MTPARNGLRSHAVVRSRSSQAKGELGPDARDEWTSSGGEG